MNVNTLIETGHGLLMMVPYAAIALLAFWAADTLLRVREPSNPDGRIKNGNVALGLRRFGLFIGIGIGLSGVYMSGTPDFATDLKDSVVYATLLVLMVFCALLLNDWVVLPNVSNNDAVDKNNVAVATVEVGSMIATGLVAKAAIAGEGGGLLATLVFFVLGQLALLASVRCYTAFHRKCQMAVEAEAGNLASGIVLGAKFMAYGLVISAAVSGPSTGWVDGISSFVITALGGIVFLLVSTKLVDWILVRSHTVQSLIQAKNPGAAFVLAGGQVGMAYVNSTLVL